MHWSPIALTTVTYFFVDNQRLQNSLGTAVLIDQKMTIWLYLYIGFSSKDLLQIWLRV